MTRFDPVIGDTLSGVMGDTFDTGWSAYNEVFVRADPSI